MCWSWPFAFMSPCPNITLPGDFSSVRVDRAIDRSPIRFRLPGPPSALWRRGFFQGAIMPSVANLPAAVFDVCYAPNSDRISRRTEMTLCARSGQIVAVESRPVYAHTLIGDIANLTQSERSRQLRREAADAEAGSCRCASLNSKMLLTCSALRSCEQAGR